MHDEPFFSGGLLTVILPTFAVRQALSCKDAEKGVFTSVPVPGVWIRTSSIPVCMLARAGSQTSVHMSMNSACLRVRRSLSKHPQPWGHNYINNTYIGP